MSRFGDAEDWRLLQRDGNSWTEYRLEWTGRLFITGYDGETPDDWTVTHCTSHTLPDISEAADFLSRLTAHMKGAK